MSGIEQLRSKKIRPWAAAVFYGGVAALFAWDWPWLALPVGVIAFLVVRRRVREGLPPITEGARRFLSIWNWITLALFIVAVVWLAVWVSRVGIW